MNTEQINNPLHGKTLEIILHHLVKQYGWQEMGRRIRIRCFTDNPSIQSSLKFLRKTPWARTKVENLYIESNEPPKNYLGDS
jgi:uncharacterized protein (DUF2132 family)